MVEFAYTIDLAFMSLVCEFATQRKDTKKCVCVWMSLSYPQAESNRKVIWGTHLRPCPVAKLFPVCDCEHGGVGPAVMHHTRSRQKRLLWMRTQPQGQDGQETDSSHLNERHDSSTLSLNSESAEEVHGKWNGSFYTWHRPERIYLALPCLG